MKISTSILDCNDRVDAVLKLNRTNNSYIHIDVMDGKFVSGVNFQNIDELKEISRLAKYPMDIHLMMEEPLSYIEKLKDMNIEFITIHLEIDKDIKIIIDKIKSFGYKVGLSIKPNTLVSDLKYYLDVIDMVLIMSVEPGLGGQKFMESTLGRVKELKELIVKKGRNILIEVDGGINDETIKYLNNVDIAVVGSYIVKSDNYYSRIQSLLDANKLGEKAGKV